MTTPDTDQTGPDDPEVTISAIVELIEALQVENASLRAELRTLRRKVEAIPKTSDFHF